MTRTTNQTIRVRCAEYDDPFAQCGACDAKTPRTGPWHESPAPQPAAETHEGKATAECWTCAVACNETNRLACPTGSCAHGGATYWHPMPATSRCDVLGHDVREMAESCSHE